MSGPPAMFPCPWCGMSYPAKPVLIGKPVRCKGCRNAFVLQPDWVATKVEDPPAAAPAAPAAPAASASAPASAPAPAPAPAPQRIPPASIEPISVVAPAPQPRRPTPPPVAAAGDDILDLDAPPAGAAVEVQPRTTPATPPPSKASERIPKRKTEMLEAARAQMAAQLADVAAKAANSEAAKREEKKSQRIAKAGSAVPSGGGKPASRKAVLSGHGERHHRELLRMWAGIGVVAIIVLLLLFVFSLRSTVRESLDFYAAEVPGEQNRYPALGDVVRSRAWLVSAPSMLGGPVLATDLSDADVEPERSIALEQLQPLLADLKGMRLDAGLEVWAVPKELDRVRGQLGERRGAEAVQALTAARIRGFAHRTVLERLGLDGEDRDVVIDLLCGNPSANGEHFARRMLDQGEIPARLVLRRFSGRKGSLLQDIGRPPYRAIQGPYTGVLMRIEGEGWPGGWRVLYLSQTK